MSCSTCKHGTTNKYNVKRIICEMSIKEGKKCESIEKLRHQTCDHDTSKKKYSKLCRPLLAGDLKKGEATIDGQTAERKTAKNKTAAEGNS